MMLLVLLCISIVNLALLLCVCNEILDIRDYIFYKEVMSDESDLRDN